LSKEDKSISKTGRDNFCKLRKTSLDD